MLIVYNRYKQFQRGVWGLGFGVWGLGFGVWGLGFLTGHNYSSSTNLNYEVRWWLQYFRSYGQRRRRL